MASPKMLKRRKKIPPIVQHSAEEQGDHRITPDGTVYLERKDLSLDGHHGPWYKIGKQEGR